MFSTDLSVSSLYPEGPVSAGPGILDLNFKKTKDSGFKFQRILGTYLHMHYQEHNRVANANAR